MKEKKNSLRWLGTKNNNAKEDKKNKKEESNKLERDTTYSKKKL
jgi:hypothetical protein